MTVKGKTLFNDLLHRWRVGEIGNLELTDFEKYDYFVTFDSTVATESTPFYDKGEVLARAYFFKSDEIEVIT